MNEQEFRKKVDKKLDDLAEKLDNLTKVVAVSSHSDKYMKGKSKAEQIQMLWELGFPGEVIALMVGATPNSVYSTLSQIRSKKKDSQIESAKEGGKNDER